MDMLLDIGKRTLIKYFQPSSRPRLCHGLRQITLCLIVKAIKSYSLELDILVCRIGHENLSLMKLATISDKLLS